VANSFGLALTVLTVVTAAVWLYSVSVPGIVLLPGLIAVLSMVVIAVVWMIWALVTVAGRSAARRLGAPFRASWYLAVVPAIGVALVCLTLLDVPVRARFQVARPALDRYADEVLAASAGLERSEIDRLFEFGTSSDPRWDRVNPEVPATLGGYRLSSAVVVPEGLIIFDRDGAFMDDAGFAYLPNGEFPRGNGAFESPDFRALGGDWYAFTSSW
jgi:hypothetical protein